MTAYQLFSMVTMAVGLAGVLVFSLSLASVGWVWVSSRVSEWRRGR